jgi:hypothetical protein
MIFRRKNILLHMAIAKLTVGTDDDGVQHREAEISLVLDPLMEPLAKELGPEVHDHLFAKGEVRPELEKATLDLRVGKQAVRVCAGVDGSVELIQLRNVEIGSFVVVKKTDEDAGTSWLKATLKAKFDLAPRLQRDFLAAQFGAQLYYSFEPEDLSFEFSSDEIAPTPDPAAGDVLDEQNRGGKKAPRLKKGAKPNGAASAEA